MKPLDKKQIPQVAALAVFAVAFFGYFIMKMILPTPAAAGTQTAAPSTAKAPVKTSAADAVSGVFTVPAPGPGMHDPFVPGVSDQPTQVALAPAAKASAPAVRMASLPAAGVSPLAIPSVPALPFATIKELNSASLGAAPAGIPARPAAPVVPAAPSWTVTGVLQSGAEHVAILRSGDARRFVKQGDYLDNEFAVALVTRDSVILRHGHSRFVLPLGGSKAAPAGGAKASTVLGGTAAFPTQGAASRETAPDSKSPPKDPASSAPDIARLPVSGAGNHGLPAPVHHPLFSLASRRAICPKVRVAGYQSENASPLFPTDGVGSLLPTGMEAPDFSLSALDGAVVSLSQFRGRVVVLDFWASWYAPSVRSLSALERLQSDLGQMGLTVLAVNSWDSKTAMQAALQGGDVTITHLYDPSVSNASVAVRLYRSSDVPTVYVIDQEGRIAGAFVGGGLNVTRNVKAILADLGLVPEMKTL